METADATRVPSPEMEIAQETSSTNLPEQISRLKIAAPMIDPSTGDPIRKHGHTATVEFGEVVGAIAAVMCEIQPVEKGGRNTFHDYKYARMQDILQALTPLMGKHGVVVFQYEAARNMFDDGKVMAITYDFIVAHKSGQTWINPVPQTGMSPCRTSKATFDDKAFAKCHTSARKYFLLSLFQIPTEDEDADEGPKKDRTSAPVPGPTGHMPPHRLDPERNEKFDGWAARYLKTIALSKNPDELVQWDNVNDDLLTQLSNGNPDLYANVLKTVSELQAKFAAEANKATAGPNAATETAATTTGQPITQTAAPIRAAANPVRPAGCPDPEKDPDGFVKWAIKRMDALTSSAELTLIWEQEITPASDGLFKPDCDALQEHYDARLAKLGE